jgi:hypothetical protein
LKKLNPLFVITKILDQLFSLFDKKGNYFLEYSAFSIKKQVESPLLNLQDHSDTALIIQGQVHKSNHKIFWMIKNYLNNHKNLVVIVSTWEGEDSSNATKILSKLTNLEKERVKIISSPLPNYPGIANINLQIISTLHGLRTAKQLGKKFVLKTRTDQGFLKHDAVQILKINWARFNENKGSLERIVIGSRNTFLFRFYSFSDMIHFGTVNTLLTFWETTLDHRKEYDFPVTKPKTASDWSSMNLAEVYLVRNYLRKVGIPHDLDFKTHLEALLNCFVVVDSECLGFTWTKYGYNKSPWFKNGFPYVKYEVTHSDWLNGEKLLQNAPLLEKYAEAKWE